MLSGTIRQYLYSLSLSFASLCLDARIQYLEPLPLLFLLRKRDKGSVKRKNYLCQHNESYTQENKQSHVTNNPWLTSLKSLGALCPKKHILGRQFSLVILTELSHFFLTTFSLTFKGMVLTIIQLIITRLC